MFNKSIYKRMTRSEREVAHLLKELGIFWKYEKPVYVQDDDNRPRVWTPDFYLCQFAIYVEVCGSSNFDYEYRRKIFKMNDCQVIFLHLYKDTKNWKKHLFRSIELLMDYRNHKFNEIRRLEN